MHFFLIKVLYIEKNFEHEFNLVKARGGARKKN
jgi:hypothetical protein